ncbi:hypothetical protein J2T56_001425 [Natronobacillus azotifigens]|uniref:DUF4352 domain-containing protein n=1 Tax=Natronobacillus azotifigens TaxID=472978 RepID=A0A9J6RD49_9BACI|nr:hypothetical protein [Natronobacillus azotifigens]MCZ0703137.1 hypothetical protein [Natronobacillus azotifigens]
MKKILLSMILLFTVIGCSNNDGGASSNGNDESNGSNQTTENEEARESSNDLELEPGHESHLKFGEKGVIYSDATGAHYTIQHHSYEFVNDNGDPVEGEEEPSYILIEVEFENLSDKEWEVQSYLISRLYYNNGTTARETNHTGRSEDFEVKLSPGQSITTTLEYKYYADFGGTSYIAKNEDHTNISNVIFWNLDLE